MNDVRLVPLEEPDREQFVKDNQEAFNYGALKEFGRRDDHFEEDGQIISRRRSSLRLTAKTPKPIGLRATAKKSAARF